jgi:hypothetical protein
VKSFVFGAIAIGTHVWVHQLRETNLEGVPKVTPGVPVVRYFLIGGGGSSEKTKIGDSLHASRRSVLVYQ